MGTVIFHPAFLQFADLFVVVVQGGLCRSRKHKLPSKENYSLCSQSQQKIFFASHNWHLNVIQVFSMYWDASNSENHPDMTTVMPEWPTAPTGVLLHKTRNLKQKVLISRVPSSPAGHGIFDCKVLHLFLSPFFTHWQEELKCEQQGPVPPKLPKLFLPLWFSLLVKPKAAVAHSRVIQLPVQDEVIPTCA